MSKGKQSVEMKQPCPQCGLRRLISMSWEAPLRVLKFRSWVMCKEPGCAFQEEGEKFKDRYLTT